MPSLSGEITSYAVTLQGAGGRVQAVIRLDVTPAPGSTDLLFPRVVLTFADAPPTDNIVFGNAAVLLGAGVDVILETGAFATVIHLLQTERPVCLWQCPNCSSGCFLAGASRCPHRPSRSARATRMPMQVPAPRGHRCQTHRRFTPRLTHRRSAEFRHQSSYCIHHECVRA